MSAAATEIIVHALNDLASGRTRIRQQQAVGLENHAGSTESALKGVILDKSPLQGVKPSTPGKSFNGFNFASRHTPDGNLTRGECLVVDKDGAGTAQPLAATKFRAAEAQIGSQNPQKGPITIDFDTCGFVVKGKLDGLDHLKSPGAEGILDGDTSPLLKNSMIV
jgi:hypothetical protein